MKRQDLKFKLSLTGAILLLILSVAFVINRNNNSEPTDRDLELAREYSRGYTDGYNAKQQFLQWEVESWKNRYVFILELYENERNQ